MEVELDLNKSVPENAAYYYEQSKKAKKKLIGLKQAMEKTKKEIKKKKEKEELVDNSRRKKRERDWYEKYHWFFTSDGLLVIAGRDAKTNTEIVRKHMQSTDLYFHAEIHGAPSTIIVSNGKEIPVESRKEAAQFAGVYSKAFGAGVGAIDVYCVKPEQVKTAAKSGEYLPKGAFVILGEREWYKDMPVRISISFDKEKNRVFVTPNTKEKKLTVVPGKKSKGELAKLIKKFIDKEFNAEVPLDEIIQVLPAGKGRLK